ncbi:MAG: transposase [Candidatus Absconditabacterales bacterium]
MIQIFANTYRNKYRTDSPRLPEWDYSEPGSYFITICTKGFVSYFGNVIEGEMGLNDFGSIIQQEIYSMENDKIEIETCVIMPNHVHVIITIHEDPNVETSIYGVSMLHAMEGHAMNRVSTEEGGITGNKNPMINKHSISYLIRQFKGKTTFLIRKHIPLFAWQSNYYEHIIRDENDFGRIHGYILNNPLKRRNDEYYT